MESLILEKTLKIITEIDVFVGGQWQQNSVCHKSCLYLEQKYSGSLGFTVHIDIFYLLPEKTFSMWYCLCFFKICATCSAIRFLNSVVTNISPSAFCTLRSLKSHCPRPFKLKSISSSFYDSKMMLRDLGHERQGIKVCWTLLFAANRFRVWSLSQLFIQQNFNAKGSRAPGSEIKANMIDSCSAVGHRHCRQWCLLSSLWSRVCIPLSREAQLLQCMSCLTSEVKMHQQHSVVWRIKLILSFAKLVFLQL